MANKRRVFSGLSDGDNVDDSYLSRSRHKKKTVHKRINIAPRRSFDLGSFDSQKAGTRLTYISEPEKNVDHDHNNVYYSSSELSDLCDIKGVLTDDHHHDAHAYNNNKNTLINYIGIGHDPALQTASEVRAIRKSKLQNENVCITECIGLTLDRFRSTLESQPQRLHLTFHGEYDATCDKSSVKFDRVPVLPQLLTSCDMFLYRNRTMKYYRDYIAAIARLFEEELLQFIHGQNVQNLQKYTIIPSRGIFENCVKLRALFKNIAERRFRCPYVHYRNRKFIAIWYGTWKQVESEQICTEAPNLWLLQDYHLSEMCTNRQIDAVLRQIKARYKRIAALEQNAALVAKLASCQEYCWQIMTVAIQNVVPSQVFQWLNNENNENNEICGELYQIFSKTFELIVSPKDVNNSSFAKINNMKQLLRKRTASEEAIAEQRIRRILEEILRGIRQDSIASAGLQSVSQWLGAPLLNYKILRFVNDASIACVRTKVIAKFQRKYRASYEITFLELHYASLPSHLLCGYVPINEQKSYEINGKDEISQIIACKLRSRKECAIKLLLLLGCHSYALAQIFSQYIECIICVHPHTEIDDAICVKFSQYFYQQLAKYDLAASQLDKYCVKRAFDSAMDKLKKSYRNDSACQFHKTLKTVKESADIKQFEYNEDQLMIVRIDRDKHNELKKYVMRHQMHDDIHDNDDDSWQWHENKCNPCFSYTMINCSNSVEKSRICELLNEKKYAETFEISQKLRIKKRSHPHRKGLLSETEDDVNYVNLRWDVITNVPQCECTLNIPHRIEDELILLINGKHIDRAHEFEQTKKSKLSKLKRSKSIPNIAFGPYDAAG